MKILQKTSCFLILCTILCGCATSNQVVDNSEQKIDSHPIQIEQQKGRIDTETAIARTLKYNLETIKKQLSSKINGSVAQTNAFHSLQKIREGQNLNLATSLKELDFAILSASVNTTENPQIAERLLSQATAHNLTLGAIKAHKTAMYGHKKSFEWNRLIRQYQSQIASLLKKTQNDLSEEDFAYQRELENTIDHLKLYLRNTEQNAADFYQLTKLDSPYPDLEGKTFYEKTVLPPQSKADSYQKSAFANRLELKNIPSYSLDTIALDLADQYPESSASVSGFYLQDSTQDENLSRLGDEVAVHLLQTTNTYQKAGNNNNNSLKSHLSEDLHKAIYLQLELAHRLAARTTADYDIQQNNLKQLKQNIQKLEKLGRPNIYQKIDLLKAKQELWDNENLADQILAERTVAVCALQFYSGLIEPTPELLDKNITDIASFVNTSLHKKNALEAPRSIAKISSGDEYALVTQRENWAHKENWLEDLMAEKQTPQPEKIMSKPLTSITKTSSLKNLQLGSFLDRETAQKEWEHLTKDFPELSQYTPEYDTTSVAGISLHRLSIKVSPDSSKELCTHLHQKGKECILSD